MQPDREHAQARLDDERRRVEGMLRDLRRRLNPAQSGASPEVAEQDAADIAVDTVERQKDLAVLHQLEAELAEIDAAVRRVADGTYGRDEVTGEPIDPARLEALPAARTNVDTHPNGGRSAARRTAGSPRRREPLPS